MICQFKRLIYPKAVMAGDASYMIALYRPCEKVMDAAGNVISEIKAVVIACRRQIICAMICADVGAGAPSMASNLKSRASMK